MAETEAAAGSETNAADGAEAGNKSGINPSHDESTAADRGEQKKPEPAQRPEWAPEDFWDTEKGELKIEDLAKGYVETKKKVTMRTGDLEKKVREEIDKERLAKRPESPEKYELRLPEKVPADAWQWDESDPRIAYARKMAFEQGWSQDQFDGLVHAYVEGEIARLPDPEAEAKRLGEKGKERIERVDQWLAANVSRATYAIISKYATNADMILAVEEMMQKAGAPAFVVTDTDMGGQQILNDALVRSWMADPKYWDPAKRDANFVKKVDDAWKKLYPAKK